MCGIAGYFALRPEINARISASLAHRGPDDEGVWSSEAGVTLIHRRLRVLDLTAAGHQPMERNGLTIVFNGEIYNFRDLRRELAGFCFQSQSDTEVILAAWDRWGRDCIPKLHGMFAFAIWNEREQELFLVRDRIGEKPLYYFFDGRFLAFGSEIKAVLAALGHQPSIDYEALDDYLTYLYIPYPRTIFSGIRQLPPATWMRIGIHSGIESTRYWEPLERGSSAASFEEVLAESVRSRLESDVPLGVLLSGGLDSSTITALTAQASPEPVRTFTVGFPGNSRYDETPLAQRVARRCGCRHEVLEAAPGCAQHLTSVIRHFDQPFGNPTAVLTYILSALARKSVTVALTGDGGDELLGGYPRYAGAHYSRIPRALPSFIRSRLMPRLAACIPEDSSGRHTSRRIREFLSEAGLPLIEMYLRWVGYFSPEDKEQLYTPALRRRLAGHDSGDFLRGLYAESEDLEPLNRLAYVDTKSFLCCNVLEYADRMSMAHALELRAPFTDHRLVEFCLRVPFHDKLRHGQSKWILRRAARKWLPPEILTKPKLGFNPPVGVWLNGELRHLPELLLSRSSVMRRGLFEPQAVARLLDEHRCGRRDHSLRIWALLMLELWFRIYSDAEAVSAAA